MKNRFTFAFLLIFFVFFFSFFCLFSSGSLDSEDGWLYASVARNIYYHHQISAAPNEYPTGNVNMNSIQGADGIWRAPGSLGYSISLVPAVALSDIVLRHYGVAPAQHFPLEQEWSFHFFASFTNAFYGALLATFVLLYAHELGFSARYSVVISFLTITATNLFPLTKFSFAHMMFNAFLVASFYFVKRFGKTQKWRYVFLALISYIVVILSYNVSYFLPAFPLLVYFLSQLKPQHRLQTLVALLGLGIIGGLVFHTRVIGLLGMVNVSKRVLFEGVWGYLFSPGKSVFLYSPPLLLIPIFWHKIKKRFYPEAIAFALLTLFYLYFLGSAWMGSPDAKLPIWHGGMGWGVRYLSALIPFTMLVVFHIISQLNKWQRGVIVYPLFALGIFVQIIGMSVSYLNQYPFLPSHLFINKAEVTVYDYASFIPRYSSLLSMRDMFYTQVLRFPQTISHGVYDVRFFDGFDIPYDTSSGVIRGFRQEGDISFVNSATKPVQNIAFAIINIPDTPASSASAHFTLTLNHTVVHQEDLPVWQNKSFTIPITPQIFHPGRQELSLTVTYDHPTTVPHVIYIKKMLIDQQFINLGSIDYPDASALGSKTTSIPYHYYRAQMTDRWTLWNLRSAITTTTLNYWWISNLYYWDRPQDLIWGLFGLNLISIAGSGYLFYQHWRNLAK